MLSIDAPVSELVLESSSLAAVFDRYRIDYCCTGERSVRAVCEQRGIDPVKVMTDLELALRRREVQDIDARAISTHELITKVIGRHHRYLHRTLPWLEGLAAKVARIHGERQPSLRDLARQVVTLAQTLRAHLDDEERLLFPALLADEHELARPMLAAMVAEHETVDAMIAQLRATANDFTPPDWACASYRTLMTELEHLEADTSRHLHLENHELRPRFTGAS